MNLEEETLLVLRAKEDIASFAKIYEHYFPKIYNFCFYRTGSKEVSEDITGTVFMQAVEFIAKFEINKNAKFSTWLFRITLNRIADYYRKEKRLVVQEIEPEESGVGSEDNFLIEYRKKQVSRVLNLLRPRYKEIISLKYFLELSIPEISEYLNIKPTQVSVILHRALGPFKKKFRKTFPKSEIFDLF